MLTALPINKTAKWTSRIVGQHRHGRKNLPPIRSLGGHGWGTAYILPFFALALALTALATGILEAGAATILVLAATFFMCLWGLLLASGSVVESERWQF